MNLSWFVKADFLCFLCALWAIQALYCLTLLGRLSAVPLSLAAYCSFHCSEFVTELLVSAHIYCAGMWTTESYLSPCCAFDRPLKRSKFVYLLYRLLVKCPTCQPALCGSPHEDCVGRRSICKSQWLYIRIAGSSSGRNQPRLQMITRFSSGMIMSGSASHMFISSVTVLGAFLLSWNQISRAHTRVYIVHTCSFSCGTGQPTTDVNSNLASLAHLVRTLDIPSFGSHAPLVKSKM